MQNTLIAVCCYCRLYRRHNITYPSGVWQFYCFFGALHFSSYGLTETIYSARNLLWVNRPNISFSEGVAEPYCTVVQDVWCFGRYAITCDVISEKSPKMVALYFLSSDWRCTFPFSFTSFRLYIQKLLLAFSADYFHPIRVFFRFVFHF